MKRKTDAAAKKSGKRKPGLKTIIFTSFLVFVVLILAVLWLTQTVFLNDLYQATKRAQIKSVATIVAKNIDDDDLEQFVIESSANMNVAIAVVSGEKVICSTQNGDTMSLINFIPAEQLRNFYYKAEENGGIYEDSFSGFREHMWPDKDGGDVTTYIYVKVVTDYYGNDYAVIANAQLTPINATIETLKIILAIVTVFVTILGLVLAALLTHTVTKPIVKIAKDSRKLANDLDTEFTGDGYREAQELSDSLNYARVQIGKVDALQKELIANISHDLRTPLTLITGYAQMMKELPGEDNEENLQVVIDEATRLSSLVSEVLDVSKLREGSAPLTMESFDPAAELEAFVKRYNKLIESSGFSVEFENNLTRQCFVFADRQRLNQVIYNLVNNAVSFTGEDKLVRIAINNSGGKVRVDVIDSGEGIPKDELADIWNRYYKSNSVTHKRNRIGSGLGLSIVKEILTLHGACFGVNSEPGKGSDFYFELEEYHQTGE